LSETLGIFFDDILVVKDVEEGSQAARLGIAPGWKARSVDGESLQTTDAFVDRIMALKEQEDKTAEIAFSPPPLIASFDERPFGFSIKFDENLSLFVVDEASGLAVRRGVKVGMAITQVRGTDACTLPLSKLQALLGSVTLPANIMFECLPGMQSHVSSVDTATKRATPGEDASEKPPAKFAKCEIRLDLSQPLGIFFDKECCAKGVQEESQAAKAGVLEGWKACTVDDVAVETTKELVGRIKTLKGEGSTHARISFKRAIDAATAGDTKPENGKASSAGFVAGVVAPAKAGDEKPENGKVLSADAGEGVAKEVAVALQEKLVSFDLSQSLGINFDAKLLAKSIQENSQAAQAGVCIGWRALSVGSESVQTTKDLVTKVKALKADGTDKVGITFAFPASAADASGKTDAAMVTTAAPVAAPAAPEASPDSGSSSASAHTKSVSFDLSLPLGINFDAKLVAKGVQEGSQAAKAGICIGWRALSVGDAAVQATKELVAKVKALKSEGIEKVDLSFVVTESSAEKRSSTEAEDDHTKRPRLE